jgi:hypothetical protein
VSWRPRSIPRPDDLRPVDDLEEGGDEEEGNTQCNDGGVGRRVFQEQSDQFAREDKHQSGRHGHERRAEAERRPSGERDAVGILPPICEPDTNGCRLAQRERDHESRRGNLKRDLMRSH